MYMFVTLETSHALMSSLKYLALDVKYDLEPQEEEEYPQNK